MAREGAQSPVYLGDLEQLDDEDIGSVGESFNTFRLGVQASQTRGTPCVITRHAMVAPLPLYYHDNVIVIRLRLRLSLSRLRMRVTVSVN